MKKSINNFLKSYLIISLLFFSFVVGSIAKAATPESKDPIKVVIMGYSGAVSYTHLTLPTKA